MSTCWEALLALYEIIYSNVHALVEHTQVQRRLKKLTQSDPSHNSSHLKQTLVTTGKKTACITVYTYCK